MRLSIVGYETDWCHANRQWNLLAGYDSHQEMDVYSVYVDK